MPNELLSLIDQHSVISFDMFDTLVHRTCGDNHTVFQLIEYQLRKDPLTKIYPHLGTSFASTRRLAERTARAEREKAEGDTEVTFDEIYDVLQEMLVIPTKTARILMNYELQMEKKVLYADPEMLKAFNYAVRTNHPVVVTSDMYLPAEVLKFFLSSCGYEAERIQQVFVSCEHRQSKYIDGELFLKIKDQYPENSVLHIGDNERSDERMANLQGLTGYHYSYTAPTTFAFSPSVAQQITDGIITKLWLNKPERSPLELIGLQTYGPLLTGFMVWLLSKMETKQYDYLLFFARDGALFYDAIDRHAKDIELASERLFTSLPLSKYVYISRAAITLPALYDIDIQKLPRMISGHEARPIREWLKLYGIYNAAIVIGEIKECGFNNEEDFVEGGDLRMNALLQKIYPRIIEASIAAKEEALKYFRQFKGKKIAIVDLGWFGSLQQNFTKLLSTEMDISVDGYYFNLWHQHEYSRASLHDNFYAYLRDHSNELFADLPNLLQTGGVELLEDVLSASHGTTLGYLNGEPILEDTEEAVKLDELRHAALEFFDAAVPLLRFIPLSMLDSLNWTRPFFRMVEFPTTMEASVLGEIQHSGGAGMTEHTSTCLAPKLDKASRKDSDLYKAAEKASYWKAAFELRNKRKHVK